MKARLPKHRPTAVGSSPIIRTVNIDLSAASKTSSPVFLAETKTIRGEVSLHYHTCFEIDFFLSGSGFCIFRGGKSIIGPDTLVVGNNLEAHGYQLDSPSEIFCLKIQPAGLSTALLTGDVKILAPFLSGNYNFRRGLVPDSGIAGLLRDCVRLWQSLDVLKKFRLSGETSVIKLLLSAVADTYEQWRTVNTPGPETIMDARFLHVMEYIEENYTDPEYRVESMARHFGVSRQELSRMTRVYSGLGLKELITHKRLYFARQILTGSDANIAAASLAAGFNDLSVFYRNFRKIFGCNPSAV